MISAPLTPKWGRTARGLCPSLHEILTTSHIEILQRSLGTSLPVIVANDFIRHHNSEVVLLVSMECLQILEQVRSYHSFCCMECSFLSTPCNSLDPPGNNYKLSSMYPGNFPSLLSTDNEVLLLSSPGFVVQPSWNGHWILFLIAMASELRV